MGQISQNSDGTYTKTYSDTELSIIRALQQEIEDRIDGDQQLWAHINDFQNSIDSMQNTDIASLEQAIVKNTQDIQALEDRVSHLETMSSNDAYSKEELDAYMVAWKVEQIAHVFDTPTSAMFDRASLDELRMGYKHFLYADIYEPYDHHVPENTMQRYTINAYAATPKQATFEIYFADRLVVLVDDVVKATYVDAGGNFSGVAKLLTIDLKEGWTQIQFLLANETQEGGLVVSSDLYQKADYLSNLDYVNGTVTGDRIQSGTIESHHISPNMDLVVRTLRATASDVPGVVVGDTNGCGSIQIGDKTITKCKDEPFVFNDGIRVDGYIRVSQLLIDKDFIRAGDGIIIDKIKDAETGFTKMYEIINDVRINNGGGLIIVGNAQDGYTITNDLQLSVDPRGGLTLTGNPITGYVLSNSMKLSVDKGGLVVTGNAEDGYKINNTMSLEAAPGLKVEGNAWEGYFLKNQLGISAEGIIVEPKMVFVDGVESYHLINDTKLDEDCGIAINKIGPGHFVIKNILSVSHAPALGRTTSSATVSGDTCTGYVITGEWPTLNEGQGIDIIDNNDGTYKITNTGILDVRSGDYINVDVVNQIATVHNTGVWTLNGDTGHITQDIVGRGDITAWRTGQTFYVESPVYSIQGRGDTTAWRQGDVFYVESPNYSIVGQGDISAWRQGDTFYVSYTAPPPPDFDVVGGTDISVTRSGNTFTVSYSGTQQTTTSPMQFTLQEYNLQSNVEPAGTGYASGYYINNSSSRGMMYFIKFIPSADEQTINVTMKGGKDPSGSVTWTMNIEQADLTAVGSDQASTSTAASVTTSDANSEQVTLSYTTSGFVGTELRCVIYMSGGGSIGKFFGVTGSA